jgi:hypothetical protein
LDLRIKLLTVAATTTTASFLLGSLLMVLVVSNLAYAQLPDNNRDDLTQAAVPAFDFNNTDKSMVVLLKFTALNKAEFVATGVAYGPPHSNSGNPPVLRVQIYDYGGGIIQQFNYWHPLFALEFQEDGKDYLEILPNAVGRFVFPFDPNAALMKVSYLHHDGANSTWAEEVISVDLKRTIPDFCDQFPDDPDCRSSDLAVVDVSTAGGQQQLPIGIGNSSDVTVQTTVTNLGPDAPIDATLSSRAITPPGSDGVLVTPATGEQPNANGTTTIVTSLNERQRYDQTYTIECWKLGKYNIIFESDVVSQSGAVADANKLNNQKQLNLEVDCRAINGEKPPAQQLGVSVEANITEDGSPPATVEFKAITEGGTQPYKLRWNFDDGSNNNNNVKGGQLMTHQFTRLGQYNVTVTVTDSDNGYSGQTASDNIIITINDKEAPQISAPPHIIVEATGPDGANVTFTVSATDIVDGSLSVHCDPASGSIFHLGTTTVKCDARDKSGNIGYGNFSVAVQDTTAPTFTVPPYITVEASGPTTLVPYPPATARDIVDPSPTVACFPSSPITIAGVGSQIVTCEASDKSGNSANGTFTVAVQDTTAPTLTLPNPSPVEATGPSGAVVNYAPPPTAWDIVDGSLPVHCLPASGYTFPVSNNTAVTCGATDKSGNSANGTFTVAVQDTTAPEIIVIYNDGETKREVEDGGTITVVATGPNGISDKFIFNRLEISATDIVDGSVEVSCSSPSGFTFPVGDTGVSCFAFDTAENTGTKSFTVTVTRCPPGQHYDSIDGFCVPDAQASVQPPVTSGPSECSEGEELVDGECQPICSEGEELVDGECQPICSEGEELVDGECVEVDGGGDNGGEVFN